MVTIWSQSESGKKNREVHEVERQIFGPIKTSGPDSLFFFGGFK